MMSKKRILLIDSESIAMRMFSDDLNNAGYVAIFIASFNEARRNIQNFIDDPYDLIAMNIGKKEFTGCDFCKELRQAGIVSPIIVQSGYNDDRSIVNAMRCGASDYLIKPYSKEELIRRVQILLEMPQLVDRKSATISRSNLPLSEDYCARILARAIDLIDAIRPYAGTLPAYQLSSKDEARPLPFDEKTAQELRQVLVEVQEVLGAERPDLERLALLRVSLIKFLQQLTVWLSGRATVVTDEMLKNLVKVGGVVVVAHAMGLKVDIVHLSAALGVLSSSAH